MPETIFSKSSGALWYVISNQDRVERAALPAPQVAQIHRRDILWVEYGTRRQLHKIGNYNRCPIE